ncbi:NACHT domain-containing protein [Sorangium sp. So ce394]|uniref:NACHT domain-containing protein n=1 Tax=Sorangium sp. So ce394 TaxID=3133310 RepID=UPI003F5BACDC
MAPKQPDPALAPSATPNKAALSLLLSQLPVIGGGITAVLHSPLATWAKEHPGTTTLLVLAYEASLMVGGVLKKVWSNLEPEVVTGLTDGSRHLAGAAQASLLNLVSSYRRRYLRRLLLDHRSFNVRGLRTQGAFTIHLDQVFVEVRITPNSAQQVSLSPLGGKELSGNRTIWDFLSRTAQGEGEALALLGPPGSGKTTLLQHVALTLAAHRKRPHRLRALLPIFLSLREHTAAFVAASPSSLGDLAQAYFAKKLGEPPPPRWFERQLQAGACVVLFDGLDEVADDEARARVSSWVDQQIAAYPRSPFVLTSRGGTRRSASMRRRAMLPP